MSLYVSTQALCLEPAKRPALEDLELYTPSPEGKRNKDINDTMPAFLVVTML